MANVTVRNLGVKVQTPLRLPAASNGCSMAEEGPANLALSDQPQGEFAEACDHYPPAPSGLFNGADLELLPREPAGELASSMWAHRPHPALLDNDGVSELGPVEQ